MLEVLSAGAELPACSAAGAACAPPAIVGVDKTVAADIESEAAAGVVPAGIVAVAVT